MSFRRYVKIKRPTDYKELHSYLHSFLIYNIFQISSNPKRCPRILKVHLWQVIHSHEVYRRIYTKITMKSTENHHFRYISTAFTVFLVRKKEKNEAYSTKNIFFSSYSTTIFMIFWVKITQHSLTNMTFS